MIMEEETRIFLLLKLEYFIDCDCTVAASKIALIKTAIYFMGGKGKLERKIQSIKIAVF